MTYVEEKSFVREKAAKLKIDLPRAGWYLPMGKNCLVARLPSQDRSPGGILFAEVDKEPSLYGVLVAAGLGARDVMRGALIEIGDIVKFGKFEGAQDEFDREKLKQGVYLIQMKIEGINGSVEADKRAEECDLVEVEVDGGRTEYVWVPQKKTAKRKAA